MVTDQSPESDGLYMTVEQYLALDEATDGKYEYLDGYAFMLRPPSSAYDDPDRPGRTRHGRRERCSRGPVCTHGVGIGQRPG